MESYKRIVGCLHVVYYIFVVPFKFAISLALKICTVCVPHLMQIHSLTIMDMYM